MSNYRLFIFMTISILSYSCTKDKNQLLEQTLSGDYAKIWVLRDKDDLSGSTHYVFFKSGKAKLMILNAVSGVFHGYFSSGLAGDVVNLDYEWYVKADTLSIMGSKYKIKNISMSKDTILLEDRWKDNNKWHSHQYYLISTNLLTH